MLIESDLCEDGFQIGCLDFLWSLIGICGQQHGRQTLDDGTVAVGGEAETSALARQRHQPDLTHAPLHLEGVRVVLGFQRWQSAAEIDDVPVSVLPLVEQFEILDQLIDRHIGSSGKRTGKDRVPNSNRNAAQASAGSFIQLSRLRKSQKTLSMVTMPMTATLEGVCLNSFRFSEEDRFSGDARPGPADCRRSGERPVRLLPAPSPPSPAWRALSSSPGAGVSCQGRHCWS